MSRVVLAVMVLAASLVVAPSAPAAASDDVTFEGSGWGHGVGFSQYGAYGQALAEPSKSGEAIASYYFTGSQPADISSVGLADDHLLTDDAPLWVGLVQNVDRVEVTPVGGSADLCQGSDCTSDAVAAEGDAWTFEVVDGGCAWFRGAAQQTATAACHTTVTWADGDGVEVRDLTNSPLICGSVAQLSRCQYRRGRLEVRADPAGAGFHVVLAVGLDDYLKGLRELPDDWTVASVNEAQAVVARSYAAVDFLQHEDAAARTSEDAGLSSGQKDLCWCHTYDDTRDQYFVGHDKEVGAPHWAAAVDATAGRVLTYFGADWQWSTESGILQGFYSSSPGPWTESNTVGFGSSVQYPYLHPVADPWSSDPAVSNPYASWTESFTRSSLAGLLGVDAVSDVTLVDGPPGAVVSFATTTGGVPETVELSGSALRSTLGLRSASVLAIDGVGAAGGSTGGSNGTSPVFDDIAGSVHEEAIEQIYAAGITIGCRSGTFCIHNDVLRGQMASFVARALALPPVSTDYAVDDAASVHEDNINRIYAAGIPLSCGPGLYCPSDVITREHMAVFLYRALDLPDAENDVFTDDEGSLYEREINAIASAGITLGCADGLFCPDEAVSRGQMASFLVRAFLDD